MQDILEKIKERKKLKEQLADRKSLAAQNRMKSIAGLAADEKAGKKRKRNDQGALRFIVSAGSLLTIDLALEDDGFGRSDADWAIYREIVGHRTFSLFWTKLTWLCRAPETTRRTRKTSKTR